jgi:glucose/mannose-6-phosphate isomerase
MRNLIEYFGQQLRDSLVIASKATLTPAAQSLHHVTVAGMGGSGIGGAIVQAFTVNDLSVPLQTIKSYDIPAYVGKNTLFVACSFSGNTEETIACLEKALEKNAKIVCITSGGKMMEFAQKHNLDYITIPGESKSPRASIGYSFVQLLKVLNFYGLTKSDYSQEIASAANLIDGDQTAIHALAKELAQKMKNKFTFFYGDSSIEALLLRTQQQINENSKQICHINTYPEMNHNELVGWKYPTEFFKNALVIFMLTDYDNARTRMRIEISKAIYEKIISEVVEVKAKGANFVEQVIYLNNVFDWTSFYLAEANNVDPFPVEVIDFLKNELAKK